MEPTSKRGLFWLALSYSLFVVYGSLVPLEFEPHSLSNAIQSYQMAYSGPWSMARRSDWFANLLLFMPLTYLWMAVWAQPEKKHRNILLSAVLVILAWALCSSIEFTQLFFKDRTVSINDVVAETTGGIIGISLWWGSHSAFYSWYGKFVQEHKENKWRAYLELYVFAMLAYSLMPLDLSLSPADIYHKWKSNLVQLAPFIGWKGAPLEIAFSLVTDILLWVPLPLLWLKTTTLSPKHVFGRVVITAFVIEFCQLFVLSRMTDSSDIVTAALGAWLGIYLVQRKNLDLFKTTGTHFNRTSKPLYLFLGWSIVLALLYWYPYNFSVNKASINSQLALFFTALFKPYQAGSEFTAITQIFRKLLLAAPLGLALGLLSLNHAHFPHWKKLLFLAPALIVLTFIELCQLLIPQKVVHQTDVLLGLVGAAITLFATRNMMLNRIKGDQSDATSKTSYYPHWLTPTIGFIGLYLTLTLLPLVPGLPYNVKELLQGDWIPLQALLLSTLLLWTCSAPLALIQWLAQKAQRTTLRQLLGLFIFHLISSAILLRLTVPKESLYDVIGAPTWGVAMELELICRSAGLLTLFLGSLYAASLLFSTSAQGFTFQLLKKQFWACYLFLLLPISYLVVVVGAGTDNLIELLEGGGYSLLTLTLPIMVLLSSILGLWTSYQIRQLKGVKALYWAFGIILSLPVGYLLVSVGTEDTIYKYQSTFSALQFLLSTDRESYLAEHQLFVRYALIQLVVIFGLGLSQLHLWGLPISKKRTSASVAHEAHRPAS